MAVDHVKSTIITNLDASPAVIPTAGEGGPAPLKFVDGYATAVAASSVDATYQICRVPSNAKIKSMILESEAQGAGAFDIGVYYATDGIGGKPVALLAAAAISRALFGSAVSLASLVTPIDVVNESTTYSLDKRNQPLWQAAGLSSDPGGNFDIVMTVTTTAVTTGTGKMGLKVLYTD
jgi:hypothetical protein